ncbi:hypothetical protein Pmar_PMAR002629, partial [Perkinsus marinus ATCC 50983]
MRYFSDVKMDNGDINIYDYLDRIESAVAMCASVGLHLQPSQINLHYREGLHPTLRKTADENYAAIDDVQQLTQALRSHIRCNPKLYISNANSNKAPPVSTATSTKAPNPKLPRVEDPETLKLCREQGICLAWTARRQCRYADNCKYKHSD